MKKPGARPRTLRVCLKCRHEWFSTSPRPPHCPACSCSTYDRADLHGESQEGPNDDAA